MDKKDRYIWPDICKGIAIILVVLGHAIGYVTSYGRQNPGTNTEVLLSVHNWIYSFHMPLFFFVSGFLQKISEKRKKMTYSAICQKIINIIIPYIIFSILFWIFKTLFSQSVMNPITVKDLFLIVIFPLSDMWFLYALCVLYILHVVINGLKVNTRIYFFVSLIISVFSFSIVWNDNFARTALPGILTNITYYASGFALYEEINKLQYKKTKYDFILWLTFIALGLLFCFAEVGNSYMNGLVKVLSAYSTIIGTLYLAKNLNSKQLQFLGANSLYVYLVHDYAVCASVIFLAEFHLSNFIMVIIATLSGLITSLLVIWITSKYRMLNAVFKPNVHFKSLE